MDIALCTLDKSNMKLQYAGAYNPLWIIRNNEILEYKANKQPIGPTLEGTLHIPFNNHEINLEKGDMIYIFSDGYADQFGGEKGIKYMKRRMKDLLISVSTETPQKQHDALVKSYDDWKGNHDQIDDICVIGVRV